MIINILLSMSIPLVFLYMIWSLEIFAVSRVRFLIGAFLWGAASFMIAFVVQSTLIASGQFSFLDISLFIAPVVEEVLKALLIVYMVYRMHIRYSVDGTAYGFAIGTGFAVCENLLYVMQTDAGGFQTAIARSFSVSLMHTFNIALIGAISGSVVFYRFRTRLNRISLVILFAIFVHAIFNQIVANAEGFSLVLIGIFIGLTGTAAIVLVIERSLRTERRQIESALYEKLTAGELAASINPQAVTRILDEQRHILGEHRAVLVQQYANLQAERGILRKTLELNRRARHHDRLQNQLRTIENRLTSLRGEMGLVTWIWLRSILPSDESAMWTQLGQHLDSEAPIMALLYTLGERQAEVSEDEVQGRIQLLRKGTLFSGLATDELEDLALLLREKQYAVGEAVVQRGVVDDRLFIVAEGSLVASVTDQYESETIITGYQVGDTFGELSMIDLQQHPATVTSMDNTRLYSLTRDDLLTLMFAEPQIALELMRQLVLQIRQQTALLLWVQETYQIEQADLDTEIFSQLSSLSRRLQTRPLQQTPLDGDVS